MSKKLIVFLVISVFVVFGLWADENPLAVSPGSEIRATIVNQVCPTFSWTQMLGATSYRVVVFEMRELYDGLSYYENQAVLSSPVLIKEIPGSASSWTPSLEEALQNGGRYVWFVEALDTYGTGTWSVGKKFAVRASMGLTEIREKVKKQLESQGVKGDLVDEAFKGIESEEIKIKEGEIKGKLQAEGEESDQAQIKTLEKKEIRSELNQTASGTTDYTASTLASEGDTNQNVYYGTGAGISLDLSVTGGLNNSFFGYNTGYSTTTGDRNVFLGMYAGRFNTTGNYNTCIGSQSGYTNSSGNDNTFVGIFSGYYTTGGANTFIGSGAGYKNSTGIYNVFLGYWSGYNNTGGSNNVFMGSQAGYSNSTGLRNIFLGYKAGYYETGSDRLYIENSDSSAPLIYGEFDNDLVNINGQLNVVDGGYLGLTGSTNQITIDTTSSRARFKLQADGGGVNQDDYFNFTMRNDYGDVTLSVRDSSAGVWLPMLSYEYLNSKVDFKNNDIVTTGTISSGGGAYTSGGAWIEASSRDYKENIMELDQDESVQALESLNPVRYNYKNKKDEEFLGFIAEDVPDLVAMNGRKGMRAMDIVAVLTKVVQNQQKTINELKAKIEELEHK